MEEVWGNLLGNLHGRPINGQDTQADAFLRENYQLIITRYWLERYNYMRAISYEQCHVKVEVEVETEAGGNITIPICAGVHSKHLLINCNKPAQEILDAEHGYRSFNPPRFFPRCKTCDHSRH